MEGDKTTVLPLDPTPYQKEEFRFKKVVEQRERGEKKDIPSASILMIVAFSDS